ncbi:hypothetical protein EZV62_011882 [Acer yangbiense]|uniref:Retroviral polymerase SH3-like domain-containing protein n=1 Tax=Acer yangbiense TaxID=1000413 RepID=A0A5C7I766_9ROSI|nr:hypothetical protein EZV62_011882 [Acer yangbiense]
MKPSAKHLKVFGSICYSHVADVKRSKLDDKAEMGIFLGYAANSKGYRVFNLQTNKLIIGMDIQVEEDAYWDWENEQIQRTWENKAYQCQVPCHREAEKNGEIQLLHYKSEEQQADILTKALAGSQFNVLRSKLGVFKKSFNEECLGDFGSARMHHHEQLNTITRVIGTAGYYMSPEVVGTRRELLSALDDRIKAKDEEVERVLNLGLLRAYPDADDRTGPY